MKSKLTKSFFRPMTISALMRKRFAAELFFLLFSYQGELTLKIISQGHISFIFLILYFFTFWLTSDKVLIENIRPVSAECYMK